MLFGPVTSRADGRTLGPPACGEDPPDSSRNGGGGGAVPSTTSSLAALAAPAVAPATPEGTHVAEGRPGDSAPDEPPSLLARICDECRAGLPIDGVSVSVVTSTGNRMTVQASDDVASRLDDLQYDLGEGPSVAAFADRKPVTVGDLADLSAAARWPAFAPAAVRAGARAVFAYPLQLGAARLGVLLTYRNAPGQLDAAHRARTVRLADGAFHAVLDLLGGSAAGGATTEHRPGGAVPLHRAEVYQAAGMVMSHLGVSIEEATVRLRAYAFARDRPVIDVARDIVARGLRLDGDNAATGPAGRSRDE